MIEKRGTGIYNAVGPVPGIDLGDVVNTARAVVHVPVKVTWVPRSWLSTWKDKEPFGGLLFWEFNKGGLTGISNARALAQGLETRSLRVTLADTLRSLRRQPPQPEIFAGFRPKPDHSGYEPVRIPWPAYLQRESALLSAWHEQGQRSREF